MLFSSLTASGRVRHRTATSLTLTGDGPVPIQIDGEPIGRLPARVRLDAGAVRLLAPLRKISETTLASVIAEVDEEIDRVIEVFAEIAALRGQLSRVDASAGSD